MKKYIRGKKNNPELIKKIIINKKGDNQTVYVLPDRFVNKKIGYRKTKQIKKVFGYNVDVFDIDPNINKKINRKGDVRITKEYDFAKKYGEKSITYRIMTGKIPYVGGKPKLNEIGWKKLIKEHEGFLVSQSSKFNYGRYYGDRFNELKQIAILGFFEGVKNYGKIINPKNPFDFNTVVYRSVIGRLKNFLSKELRVGLSIPQHIAAAESVYKMVKDELIARGNKNPDPLLIAKELQKKWTKKTFNSKYVLAEEDLFYKVKGMKEYIRVRDAEEIGLPVEERKIPFDQLPKVFQEKLKEEDKLPLTGYTSLYGDRVLKAKQLKYEQKLKRIEKKYDNLESRFRDLYNDSQVTTEAEYESRKKTLQKVKEDVDRKFKIYKDAENDYHKQIKDYAENEKRLNDALKSLKKKKEIIDFVKQKDVFEYEKKYKEEEKVLSSQIILLENKFNQFSNPSIKFQKFEPIANNVIKLKDEYEKELSNYETLKKIYPVEPMSQKDFDMQITRLREDKKIELKNAYREYSLSQGKTLIPGILERIKEFENIKALREFNIDFIKESEKDDENISPIETIFVPQLNEEEKLQIIEEHRRGKEALRRGIKEYLIPIYKDIMQLHLGLHKDCKKEEGQIWGELQNNKQIVDWLDKNKMKTDMEIGNEILRLSEDKKNFDKRANAFISNIPFLSFKYQNEPKLILNDFINWKKQVEELEKQLSQKVEKKVKISLKEYEKMKSDYYKRKKKSSILFRNKIKKLKRKGINLDAKKREELLKEIREKLRATREHFPTKFIVKKMPILNKQKLENIKSSVPSFTYTSDSKKQIWVSDSLDKARHIIRSVIPIEIVHNLIIAHRKMIEYGLLEKALLGFGINWLYKIVKNEL